MKFVSWRGIVVGLLLLALWTLRPIGVNAPSSVETPFNADRAVTRLTKILGDERAHPTDSDANDAVEARLLAEIRKRDSSRRSTSGFIATTFAKAPRSALGRATSPFG
ncbi:hypothetical protein [Sphingopyxis sp.]|uniref:hypothetical protein n=1 Tax=Sphingopyxis sp. TaxID=1908224 RepID=UPI003D6CC73C